MIGAVGDWATSFLLTLSVEVLVAGWLWWRRPWPRWKTAAAVVAGTSLTHPMFWFVLPWVLQDYWTYIVVGELSIVAVEAVVLASALPAGRRESLAVSALMNGASYLIGLTLRALAG